MTLTKKFLIPQVTKLLNNFAFKKQILTKFFIINLILLVNETMSRLSKLFNEIP